MKKVLFLYTEISPYLVAGLGHLVAHNAVEVHLVRWPVNKEAPFSFPDLPQVTVHERTSLDLEGLRALVKGLAPDVILASGWVDKAYLRVCQDARKRGIPTVMASDTAWRGDLRQWFAVGAARLWLHRTFSHAWVTGEAQARYAAHLGFAKERIRRGFYVADLNLFASVADRLRGLRSLQFPHRLLCVARYIPSKGHQYMVEAFAELADAGQVRDWELWCIGTGELFPLAFQHPRIRHLGFVQPEGMWRFMEQSGVFILPSLYEPWGVVVQEHAAAGFPLLLSDAVGARHSFLKEGYNGFSFTAGNKKSLKETLLRVIALSDADLAAMGRHSEELAKASGPGEWSDTLMGLIAEGHA
ncbi:MAG: glycosyltransferase family 4 protein [Flavobacteriales bacterium]|nr:glycosyltransferase family 4 protein [Flavobacteriales bacterium]